jgi:hypothetical protein
MKGGMTMSINEQISRERAAMNRTGRKASNLFQVFMDEMSELDQKDWRFEAWKVNQGFFIYHFDGTVCSIGCSNGDLTVDFRGASNLNLPDRPAAHHGVWPSWKRTMSKEAIDLVRRHLVAYIVERSTD